MAYSSKFYDSVYEELDSIIPALHEEDAEALLIIVRKMLDADAVDEPLSEETLKAIDEAAEHRHDPSYWVKWNEKDGKFVECA